MYELSQVIGGDSSAASGGLTRWQRQTDRERDRDSEIGRGSPVREGGKEALSEVLESFVMRRCGLRSGICIKKYATKL